MSQTKVNNIDDVTFGNMEIITTLNGGFDKNTPDEHKRKITLRFIGFDELSDKMKKRMLDEFAGKLRIKVNQAPPSGELKGRPEVVDSESYAQMLDDNDCEFTFNVNELYKPSPRTRKEMTSEEWIWYKYKKGDINESQRDQMLEIV